VDNPDPIVGITNVYIVENGDWVSVADGGTLSGDVLIEVEILSGHPVECVAVLTGPISETSYTMEWDGYYWYVVIDSRQLVNGLYYMDVVATRAEDGATAYLSVFQMDITGTYGDWMILFAFGAAIGIAFYLIRRRQKK
jgi:hypothetical protein